MDMGPESAILFAWAGTIVSILGAAVVAATGNDGWGWFLFVAVLLCPTIKM